MASLLGQLAKAAKDMSRVQGEVAKARELGAMQARVTLTEQLAKATHGRGVLEAEVAALLHQLKAPCTLQLVRLSCPPTRS